MEQTTPQRKIGILMALGLIFMPFIFGWFTMRKGYSNIIRFISFGWMITACIMLSNGSNKHDGYIDTRTENTGIVKPIEHWNYAEDYDKMRNATTYYAVTKSNEIIDLGFPYNDVQETIMIRKRKIDGTSVILQLSEGQYSCGFDGCTITVKFDDNAPVKYSVSKSSDFKSNVLFINNKTKFINKLKQSKYVMIETDLFQHGPETFTFNVNGLKWTH